MSRPLRAVPDTPGKFVIAVRVSRVGGRAGERFLSPDIQINASREAIARAGGVLDTTVGDGGIFYDFDVSGATAPSDRPGMGEALDLVRGGVLQGVAIYDLSRWSRETSSGLRELEQMAALGAQVLSASEAIDIETPAGVFSTTVQLAAHQLRRNEASRSWKATHQRRFEMGLPHGKVPTGYMTENGRAVVDPLLGPAVKDAFTVYAAGGVSQKDLATRLGGLRGRPMRQGVMSQLLRNRFYLGELDYCGQVRPGQHEPLVDEETFAAVQSRLRGEREAGPHARVPRSSAIGLLYCAACGSPAYRRGMGQRSGDRRLPALICAGKQAGICSGFGAPQVEHVEAALRDLALKVARDLQDETPAQDRRTSQAARAKAEQARLRAERDDLHKQIGRLGVLLGRGVMDETAYQATLRELQPELEMVEAQLADAEAARLAISRPLEELQSAADRLASLWELMEPIEQRAALALLLPRVLLRRAAYRGEPLSDRLTVTESDMQT